MLKKMIFLVGILLLCGVVYGETIPIPGELEVTKNKHVDNITFNIDKVENQEYILKFQHYGTFSFSGNFNVSLYLNGNLIYTINDSNNAAPFNKKTASITITNYLKNGNNVLELKVTGNNIKGNYYKITNIFILTTPTTNPTTKTPIPPLAIILTLIIISTIALKKT
ncbi:hypothetical protein ACO3UB_07515 [Methanocaldococcus sp. 16A]